MRRVLIFVFLVILLSPAVHAMDFEAPPAPDSAAEYLPDEADSFGEGLLRVGAAAVAVLSPAMSLAARCCLRVFGALALVGLARQLSPGLSGKTLELAGTAAVAALLLEPSASMIALTVGTVEELREYGKLLMPVMASALAARGGVTTSGALYVGTAVLDTVLGTAVSAAAVPLLWMYLALSVASAAVGGGLLGRLRDLIRWLMEWALKLTLYLFTGYMAVTGAVSGAADAAASRAAKIAISGAVPVVGGILSDAADTVLLSAAALGSGAGVWGILTVLAIFCAPALKIGCQYLMLKLTAVLGSALGGSRGAELAGDFAAGMGFLMALVSTQAVLLLVSGVCFLRGLGR